MTTEGQGEIETNHAWREIEEGAASVRVCVCLGWGAVITRC